MNNKEIENNLKVDIMPSIGQSYSIIESGKRIFGKVESYQVNTSNFWVKWDDGEITLESNIDNAK